VKKHLIRFLPERRTARLLARAEWRPSNYAKRAFGAGRRRTHRAVFAIRPDKIVVYRIQHLSQRDLSVDDI
jgi:hypothetical protein